MKKLTFLLFIPFLFASCLRGGLFSDDTMSSAEAEQFTQDSLRSLDILYYEVRDLSGDFGNYPVTYIDYNTVFDEIKYCLELEDVSSYYKTPAKRFVKELNEIKKKRRGGYFTLSIIRKSEKEPLLDPFSITVEDKEGKELFKGESFDEMETNSYALGNGMWRTEAEMSVDVRLPDHFYVYLEDKATQSAFKYEVVSFPEDPEKAKAEKAEYDRQFVVDSLKYVDMKEYDSKPVTLESLNPKKPTFIFYYPVILDVKIAETQEEIEQIKRKRIKGKIEVIFFRDHEYETDNLFFAIRVKDKKGEELFKSRNLRNFVDKYGINYRFSSFIPVNVALPDTFYVHLEDKLKNEEHIYEIFLTY